MKNIALTFRAPDAPSALRDPQILPDVKTQVRVMFPGSLFMETAPVRPKHEKYCVNISRLECTGMHYVTRRSHQMRKHKFGVMCPGALFMEITPGPPEHEK
jgi:hypothetical protein